MKLHINIPFRKFNFLSNTHKCFSTQPLEAVNMSYIALENNQTPSTVPPLIVMHGLMGSKRNWSSLCNVFHQKTVPQRTILNVDARNHGESPHSPHHSYQHLAEDVKTLLNARGIRKAVLLGHSMGGRAMMYFALKYPELVDKLVVADISPVSTSATLVTTGKLFAILANVDLPKDVPLANARTELNKSLSKSIPDQGLRAFLLTNLKQNPDGSYGWVMNLKALENNYSTNIVKFPVVDGMKYDGPVLFVGGGNSDFIRESDHSKIKQIFQNAEFHVIPGAGHWLHAEKPNEFLPIVLGFLNK